MADDQIRAWTRLPAEEREAMLAALIPSAALPSSPLQEFTIPVPDNPAIEQDRLTLTVELPPGTTLGDLTHLSGLLLDVATEGIDWEKLYDKAPDAVSIPSQLALQIGRQLKDAK